MAVLQMQKISICALKRDRKAILELLQSQGVMEVSQVKDDEGMLSRMDTVSSRQLFEKNALTADHALDILQTYVPEKTSMFSSLEGKALKDAKTFSSVAQNSEKILEDGKQILALSKQIAEDKANISKLEGQIESLAPWMQLDVPMSYTGTKKTVILIGTMPEMVTLEQLYQLAAEKAPEVENLDIQIISSSQEQTCLTAVCMREDQPKLEEALRTSGFAKPSQMIDEVPAKWAENLKLQIEDLTSDLERTENQLKTYENSRENLRMLSDYYRIRAQKYEILGDLGQSEKTFFMTGFVPKKKVKALEERLSSQFDVVFGLEELEEGEEEPVLLENNTFAASAEGVTASFGLPAKGEMDPTMVMSMCYVFLFGLMLSDAAYGLIITVACFWALKRFPRMDENLRKSVRLFFYCGISTLFWGVMFGGYFGDAVDVVSRVFFGTEISVPALWFIPLNDPVKLLMYSMLFGLIHLFLGMGMKAYMCIRDGRYMDLFCDVILWCFLLIGLILILLPTDLFASISQMTIVFPAALNTLAKAMAIVGAVGIVLMSGRGNKNPVLRIALGAYDLYNITGWLSDVLSYSRLLALGLATGVIASVVNQMGSMLGGGILGAIVFIVVFVVGHVFNLAINLLGAYVHTCRLQYVEFFGKFYEGGGRAFVPFKQNTKYVEIKEE